MFSIRGSTPLPALVVAAAGLLLTACEGAPVKIDGAPLAVGTGTTKLGPAEGTACGTMLLGPTDFNFIPAGLNSRTARAYAEAVASVPQATALTEVSISEDWIWWILGTTRCVTIKGEAVR